MYKYDLKCERKIREVVPGVEQSMKKKVNRDYIDNFNVCPSCKKEFKTYRNEISGIGSLGVSIPRDSSKDILIYFMCKECSSNIKYRNNKDGDYVDDYVEECVNSLSEK